MNDAPSQSGPVAVTSTDVPIQGYKTIGVPTLAAVIERKRVNTLNLEGVPVLYEIDRTDLGL